MKHVLALCVSPTDVAPGMALRIPLVEEVEDACLGIVPRRTGVIHPCTLEKMHRRVAFTHIPGVL